MLGERLKRGDKIAIVSLSSGMLGEDFCKHYLKLGSKRLHDLGLEIEFMPNALKGMEYLKENPKARFDDLRRAFEDKKIKAIICAIGGDDTFKLAEYMLTEEFKNIVLSNPKIFMGFSDTTINHLIFYKLGLKTFYGPSYINDFSEMDEKMLPYTEKYIKNYFFEEDLLPIISSDIWYEERTDFSTSQISVPRISHQEERGFELLKGEEGFSGELLGGCVESLYDLIVGNRYEEERLINEKYHIFPTDWKGKILFLETSEECVHPDRLKEMLLLFKSKNIFKDINGLIIGKPQNETFYEEYKSIYLEVLNDVSVPVLYNVNFGHAYPRCILAYGAKVLYEKGEIKYIDKILK